MKKILLRTILQVLEKKKRDYVILASNSNHTNELKANIYDFCRKFYRAHIFNHVYSTDELSKRFNKNISILIILKIHSTI